MTITTAPRTVEELAERTEAVLVRIARGSQYNTITYGVLAALITEPDEPLVDSRLFGKILYRLRANNVGNWRENLPAFVVNGDTHKPSKGYYYDDVGAPALPEPETARTLAHEGAHNPQFGR